MSAIDAYNVHDVADGIMKELKRVSRACNDAILDLSIANTALRLYSALHTSTQYFEKVRSDGGTPEIIGPVMASRYNLPDWPAELIKYEAQRDVLIPALMAHLESISSSILSGTLQNGGVAYNGLSEAERADLLIEINKVIDGF